MTILLILLLFIALAGLAPRFGADSRDVDGARGAPPPDDKLWSRLA